MYQSCVLTIVKVLLTRELRDELNYTGKMTKLSNLMKMRKSQQMKLLNKKRDYFMQYGVKHQLILPPPCTPLDQWQVVYTFETKMSSLF